MSTTLEVIFTPAECDGLRSRDLSKTVCVVFDVLRATSTMLTALANGASGIRPVSEIPEALALRLADPSVLLAGERHGFRIDASLTGTINFDLGNSPREFTREKVADKKIVMSTTNGTRALRASAGAKTVLVGALVNLQAVANWIQKHEVQNLLLVCSGTEDQASYEDTLAAGALCELLWDRFVAGNVADSAAIARIIYRTVADDLLGAMHNARNGRHLLKLPELAADVAICANRDSIPLLAALGADGVVRKLG